MLGSGRARHRHDSAAQATTSLTPIPRQSAPIWLPIRSFVPLFGRAIKTVAVLLGTGALVVGGIVVYGSIDKEDAFFLENAELSDPDFLQHLRDASVKDPSVFRSRPPVFAHRLKQGRGAVFAYRWYSNGRVDILDDELYVKLTVWFPGGIPPENTDVDLRDRSKAVVVFASGGSAWPRYACSGYISSGSVRLVGNEAGYHVEVHGTLRPSAKRPGLNHCHAMQIDREFFATKTSYERLTPWLGRMGSHPYDETYR
jgi:hypothetical protein